MEKLHNSKMSNKNDVKRHTAKLFNDKAKRGLESVLKSRKQSANNVDNNINNKNV